MAKYYLTNSDVKEYGVIMEADSLQEAIQNLYGRKEDPLYNLGLIASYNELNRADEIDDDGIKMCLILK